MVLITFFANFWVVERGDWTNLSITSEVSPRLGVGTLPPTRTLQSTLLPTMDYDSSSTESDDERLEDEEERLLLQAIHSFVTQRDTKGGMERRVIVLFTLEFAVL